MVFLDLQPQYDLVIIPQAPAPEDDLILAREINDFQGYMCQRQTTVFLD
jgi:hypothetical protein